MQSKAPFQPVRIPPSNIEAEQALIVSMLLDPEIIPKLKEKLSPESFYRDSHIHIVRALYELGVKADSVTLGAWLTSKGLLERSGGPSYIGSLIEAYSTSAGWPYYSDIVMDLALRRQVLISCSIISDMAYELTESKEDILSNFRAHFRELHAGEIVPYRTNKELVNAVWKDIERKHKAKDYVVGLSVGLSNIDKETFGLESKTTTYLIARPSIGKTALALNIAEYVALSGRVLFFSLESSDIAITRRRMSAKSGVYLHRLRTGHIDNSQYSELIEVSSELQDSKFLLLDHPKFKNIEDMSTIIESLAIDEPIRLIVVDHIQRMYSKKRQQNRHLELSYISEQISTLAKELNVPLVVLCQLSREIEKRPTKTQFPQLSDMRESGTLEANADMVWGLWRQTRESEHARLECLKARDGGTWTTWLKFDRFIQKFYDGTPPHEDDKKRQSWIDK